MRLPFASFFHRRSRRRPLLAVGLAGAALAAACGIGVHRDYSTIPPGQVGFDDLCGLQDYFDTIEAKMAKPPTLVSAVDIENQNNQRVQGGKNRFAFETEFQLKNLHRVLNENWSRLPEPLAKAERVDIEVHWSAKAGVQRVVTDSDAELIIGRESFPLPYHVCLSELLFGAPLYQQRREMSGRSLPYKPLFADGGLKIDNPDAGPPPPAPATPTAAAPSPDGGASPAAAPAPPVFKPAPSAQ